MSYLNYLTPEQAGFHEHLIWHDDPAANALAMRIGAALDKMIHGDQGKAFCDGEMADRQAIDAAEAALRGQEYTPHIADAAVRALAEGMHDEGAAELTAALAEAEARFDDYSPRYD